MSSRFLGLFFLVWPVFAQSDILPAFRVESVSAFTQYSSTKPEGNRGLAGAGLTVSYNRFNERSGLSFSYMPTFVSSYHGLESKSTNHFLRLTGRTGPNSRLRFTYGLSGMLSLTTNALFAPSHGARLAAAGSNPGDLASAVVTGDTTNNAVSTVLSEAPSSGTPVSLGIYGERILGLGATFGVRYAYTPRLSLYVNMAATRDQNLNNGVSSLAGQREYLIPYTLTGSAAVGFDYLLSPRTRIGVDLQSTRSYSRIQDGYGSGAMLSVARMMGQRWFANLHGGVGMVSMLRSYPSIPSRPEPAGGGGLGYSTYSNTFYFSVDRLSGDPYALGRTASLMTTGSWRWSRSNSPWAINFDAAHERLTGSGTRPFGASRGVASIARRLGQQFSVVLEYAYLRRSVGEDQKPWTSPNVHAGRFSFVWEPYGVRRSGS